MNNNQVEKRRSPRVFLKPGKASALLMMKKNRLEMNAKILNISDGGVGIGFKKDKGVNLNPGDDLVVKMMYAGSDFYTEQSFELKVVWILDHKGFDSIGAGCEFKNMGSSVKEGISQFININLKT